MPLVSGGTGSGSGSGSGNFVGSYATEAKQDDQLVVLEEISTELGPKVQPWTTLRSFTNASSDTGTLPPATSEFISLTGVPTTGFNKIIINGNFICNGGTSNPLIHLWRRYKGNISFVRSLIAYGQNSALNPGNFQTGDIELDITGEPTTDFAVRVELSSQRYVFSTAADNTNLAAIPNPGFAQNDNVTFSSTTILPTGLSGFISNWDDATNIATIVGFSPSLVANEKFRLNFQTIASDSIPELGVSFRFKRDDVDTINNTITLDGSVSRSFAVGDTVRLRAGGTSTLPVANGAVISATTTYTVISVSGSVGTQKLTLSSDGSNSIDLQTQGAGPYLYIFPFPYVNLTANSDSSFAEADIKLDLASTSISVSAGTASTITLTAHGFSAGRAFQLSGTTAPGGGLFGANYFVSPTNLSTNTFEVCHSPTATQFSAAFSSAGVGLTIEGRSCTNTVGTASNFNLINNFFAVRQPIKISGGPFTATTNLYVSATDSLKFTASYVQNGIPLACTSGTSNITAKVSGSGSPSLIERSEAVVKTVTSKGITLANSAGATIQINSANVGQHSLIGTVSPKIVSGLIVARAV